MPFNLLKKYPELLEILHLGDKERKASLYRDSHLIPSI